MTYNVFGGTLNPAQFCIWSSSVSCWFAMVLIMLRYAFVVGYYLLWCGTLGTVYSRFTYDSVQNYFPFIGYSDSKVCALLSLQVYTHTQHTHTTILLLFWNMSGTTRVSRYQKGRTRQVKTNLDLLEQEIVNGSGICWAICKVCTSSQTTTPTSHHSVFYRLDALPATQSTASKHWRNASLE